MCKAVIEKKDRGSFLSVHLFYLNIVWVIGNNRFLIFAKGKNVSSILLCILNRAQMNYMVMNDGVICKSFHGAAKLGRLNFINPMKTTFYRMTCIYQTVKGCFAIKI